MERGSLLNKRYRIVEILGQGGMAAVYRAIDENLGVEVAVKENLFTTEEYARQFRLEATILASLRQPNLPRVTDHFVIEQQGQYLIMDYIEGEDLRQRMDRIGALPEQEVIIIGVAICDALSYMHTRKPPVLHRDIKPGNVRITPHGHIYLVDFGLAKVVVGREATSTGARAMTPGYSPPEQYGTARTDHRSDIYSLGATLYSALTNALPEDGLARAMEQAELTPVLKHNPKVSKRLAQVIEKCLEIRPDNRYQSAEELKQELLNCRSTTRRNLPIELVLPPPPVSLGTDLSEVEGREALAAEGELLPLAAEEPLLSLPISTPLESSAPPISKPPKPRKRKGVGLGAFFILLILLMAGSVAAYVMNPNLPAQAVAFLARFATPTNLVVVSLPSETPTAFSLPTASEVPVSTLTPTVTETPSPTATPEPTATPQPTPTPTPTPFPTPIGGGMGQIAFASDRSGVPEIYLVNLDGSGLRQLTTLLEGACQPEWSPDGTRLVFISPCRKNQDIYAGSSMFIINADGTNLVPLPSVPGGDFQPNWSPDGTRIAFVSLREKGIPQIFLISLSDYSVTPLFDPGSKTNSEPAWSPDGQMLSYIGPDGRIWAMGADNTNRHPLTIGGGDFRNGDPAWSSDGVTIIFTRRRVGDVTGSTTLWAVPYSEDGRLPVQVPNLELIAEVNYSPDGYWIVYRSWAAGNHDIYIARSNGVDRQILIQNDAYDFDPAWRPGIIRP